MDVLMHFMKDFIKDFVKELKFQKDINLFRIQFILIPTLKEKIFSTIMLFCFFVAGSAVILAAINATLNSSSNVHLSEARTTNLKPSTVQKALTNQEVPTHQKTSNDFKNEQFQQKYDAKQQSVNYKQNFNENLTDSAKIYSPGALPDSLNILSNDFLSGMNKGAFSDVTLKCGHAILPAHKFVLSARSPVFEAMFLAIEGQIVLIDDLDSSVLIDMLSFIYGAHIRNLTLSKACDLMYAARAYEIKGLKEICTNYLRTHLTVETALQILQCADLYDAKLKADAMNYICLNFFVLNGTEEWKILQTKKPVLAIEIYSMVVNAQKDKKI